MHCAQVVQVNILRLMVRGCNRIGHALSQALLQSRHSCARLSLNQTTMALLLPIHARL